MGNQINLLHQGLTQAFICGTTAANGFYKPEFVLNDHTKGKKVLSSIESELKRCNEFYISVAFITLGGLTPLLQVLKDLEAKNIPGKILTTDYLMFSDPVALKKLAQLKNIEIKMYRTKNCNEGFHTKGYIFREDEMYRIIIGSSNMTMSALTKNKEWNTKLVATEEGEITKEVLNEFESLWNAPNTLAFEEFIDEYTDDYCRNKVIEKQKRIIMNEDIPSLDDYKLEPNSMQVKFINELKKICDENKNRALLISATGTGKTYASAFAMRELEFKKVLFIVHRNQIVKQAMESYRKVFGKSVKISQFLSKSEKPDSEYVFATVQTISKEENLKKFSGSEFDGIIIDEAHHSAADSYKKIMEYFKPKLWLGMTATPDKRDDNIEGRNIYEIFDHNIAYEIRLQDAMKEELLCPFHYFGVTELEIEDKDSNKKNEELKYFKYLTSDERVEHIMKKAKYFGYSGDRVKGLIFCSRKDEARCLSKKFNEKGWRTLVLTGEDSEEKRSEAIERLAGDDSQDAIDYILSVDIFSEGVDVPEINQVIMLRPTESPIVFIQQLGRGLRKAEKKEFVVIIDFIGNYNNNFMIPIALSGDRSYNKDNIRRYVAEGSRVIPGASTVHFDEISKKQIYESIDKANFSEMKLLKENYINLKNKIGHIPKLMDFDKYGEMDVLRIFDNKMLGSYYKFLVKYEKDYEIRLSEDEALMIEFISKKFANGKRLKELKFLKRLLKYKVFEINNNEKCDKNQSCKDIKTVQEDNIVNILTNEFLTGSGKRTYEKCIFVEKNENICKISNDFSKMLLNKDFLNMLNELIDFGIARHEKMYKNKYQDTDFVLYEKYTYEDACRLLNWEHNEVPLNIGGYKYDKKTKTFPVFINYDKSDEISDTIKYEDHFTSANHLIAISKSGRNLKSEDVQNFLFAEERGIDVQLFVRKNKDDKISKEFYYLGRMRATGNVKEITMPNTTKSAVEIEWELDKPVREDIYEYIVN